MDHHKSYLYAVIILLIPALAFGQVYLAPSDDLAVDLQGAIDQAGNGTLILGSGNYRHYGVVINKSTTIVGQGWGATKIINHGPGANITIDNPDMTGAKLCDFQLTGTGDALVVNSQGNSVIERVHFWIPGGRCIVFSDQGHTTMLSIIGNRLEGCLQDAIYGRWNTGAEVNAITIRGNHITNTRGNAINVFAQGLWLQENIIQGNDAAGVVLPNGYVMSGTPRYTSYQDIQDIKKRNYFEQNAGGDVVRDQ